MNNTQKTVISSLALLALVACGQSSDTARSSTASVDLPSIASDGDPLKTRDFGTADDDAGRGIAANATGVYAVGLTSGSLDGPNRGHEDAFLRRYDGGVVWAQQFGTRFYDSADGVAVDAAGNSYVIGITGGGLGFKVGSSDVFLRKYNSGGTVQWTRQFGTPAFDSATDVAVDAGGNIFVLSHDDTESSGFTIRQFSASGTLLARRTVSSIVLPFLSPTALSIDSAGSVIVLARWYGNTTQANIRVFKLTSTLADVWNVPFQQTVYEDVGFDIATFGTDIYLTLRLRSTTPFYGARYGKINAAGTPVAVVQLEPTSTCDCTYPSSIAVDASGIYVTGSTSGAFAGFTNAGLDDIVVLKHNFNGTRAWVRQFGQGANGTARYDSATAVAVSDAVYITGSTQGNLLGDPKYGTNDTDAFLAQIDKTTGAVLGIDQ
jgi:hypothetical protein